MATLAAGGTRSVNLAAFDIDDFAVGTVTTKTATTYRVAIGSDYHQFAGTFGYDGAGELLSGTITQWQRIIAGATAFTVTGLAFPVASFIAFRDSGESTGFLAGVFAGADKMTGGSLADFLQGFGANDSLTGGAANDTLVGDAGNDTLDGGAGGDSMTGGLGDDLYRVDNALDSANELPDGGIDRVETTVAHALNANVENLTLLGTAGIAGTGNDLANSIVGNSGANLLSGNAGNDTLNGGVGNDTLNGGEGDDSLIGGAGADSMVGGAGNDIYLADNASDVMIELEDGGTDTVLSNITRTLGANLENLVLTGTGAINGTGNALANAIAGHIGNNVLAGGAGSDTLTGGAGNDTLTGGGDPDTLIGGLGNDRYEADAADTLSEAPGQGIDIVVVATGSFALGANFENLTLIGSTAAPAPIRSRAATATIPTSSIRSTTRSSRPQR